MKTDDGFATAEIEISEPHTFYYDLRFHPDRQGQVAAHGWRAVAVARWRGREERAEVTLDLGREAVESIARQFAIAGVYE